MTHHIITWCISSHRGMERNMCRFINWKITILQLTGKLFHEFSDLNIQRIDTILFSSSFELLIWVVKSMPTAVLYVDIIIWGWQHMTTSIWLPVEHITYFWGWSSEPPGECGAPHPAGGITSSPVSSQCPHGDQCSTHQSCAPTARTCAAPAPAPPGSRRPHLARPRPGGEMWPSWCGASQPSTCPVKPGDT